MRLVRPAALRPGMTLANGVFDPKGNVIARAGSTLNENTVRRLVDMGIPTISIEDSRFDDLEVKEIMPVEFVRDLVEFLGECRDIIRNVSKTDGVELGVRRLNELVDDLTTEVSGTSPDDLSLINYLPAENHWDAHAMNTAILSIRLGRTLTMARAVNKDLVMACICHDLSLVLMPRSVRRNFGRLVGSQRKALWLHPRLDSEIMRRQAGSSAVMVGALAQHHELWSGGGYPKGLKGESIGMLARIIAIVDTYAALVGERPGRERQMPHEAIEFVLGYAGEYFDMDLAEKFTRSIPTYFVGAMVQLSNMQKGVVMIPNTGEIARPAVHLITDPAGRPLPVPQDVNLKDAANASLMIAAVVDE